MEEKTKNDYSKIDAKMGILIFLSRNELSQQIDEEFSKSKWMSLITKHGTLSMGLRNQGVENYSGELL